MIYQFIMNWVVGEWPIIIGLIILVTLPWTLQLWSALISTQLGRMLIAVVATTCVTWYVTRAFDNTLFDQERAHFKATLDGIDATNEAALNEALERQRKQADENNKNLANALLQAGIDKANAERQAADLQKEIDAMPDDPAPDAKGCKPTLDPVLRDILRGHK